MTIRQKSIPKAEIHCHIEGAVSPSLALVQAEKYGVKLDTIIVNGAYVWADFTSFLNVYDTVAALFRTRMDYATLSYAYLSELAAAQTLYAEFFISTDHAVRTGLNERDYIEGLADGMVRAQSEFGIISRMIATGLRHEGPDTVMRAARYIVDNPHPLVTGWGMAGDERMYHPKDFAAAFDIARDAGLGITVHAGELAGAQSVADAIEWLRPGRIGHGVRAVEDKAVIDALIQNNIVLECCAGSNIALGVYADFSTHPLRVLKDKGVCITLNSDDPPHFQTSLAYEYDIAANHFAFSDDELRQCTRTAIESGFIDDRSKASLLKVVG